MAQVDYRSATYDESNAEYVEIEASNRHRLKPLEDKVTKLRRKHAELALERRAMRYVIVRGVRASYLHLCYLNMCPLTFR
jgi:hypothetical protein